MAQSDTPPDTALDAPLDGNIGYGLKRVQSIVQSDLARVLAKHDLRAVSFSALSVIVQKVGLTQTQRAEALQIERSNLVPILDELMARKLILRAPVAHDRRRHAPMPTPKGIALASAAKVDVAQHENHIFAPLTASEKAELQRLLNKPRHAAPSA